MGEAVSPPPPRSAAPACPPGLLAPVFLTTCPRRRPPLPRAAAGRRYRWHYRRCRRLARHDHSARPVARPAAPPPRPALAAQTGRPPPQGDRRRAAPRATQLRRRPVGVPLLGAGRGGPHRREGGVKGPRWTPARRRRTRGCHTPTAPKVRPGAEALELGWSNIFMDTRPSPPRAAPTIVPGLRAGRSPAPSGGTLVAVG